MTVLSGVKIIEIQGIGPAPFCGMHLADMGADVVVIERPGLPAFGDSGDSTITKRGKKIITLDLKNEADKARLMSLVQHADGLIEGMRPGVMERLGLGPIVCHKVNPALIYGRVTGWGQDGPLSKAAGHDINYIALSGALWFAGQPGNPPLAPPTLIGDIAGGALYLTIGMLAALFKAQKTGQGDVIDAAMVDGSAHMMNLLLSISASGQMNEERGKSLLDGPHWYNTYVCSCGGYITIGALEPKFYQLLLEKLGLLDDPKFKKQYDSRSWTECHEILQKTFLTMSRSQWCDRLENTDICFAPVLTPRESAKHPQMKARNTYHEDGYVLSASPAPRFQSSDNANLPSPAVKITPEQALLNWGSLHLT